MESRKVSAIRQLPRTYIHVQRLFKRVNVQAAVFKSVDQLTGCSFVFANGILCTQPGYSCHCSYNYQYCKLDHKIGLVDYTNDKGSKKLPLSLIKYSKSQVNLTLLS